MVLKNIETQSNCKARTRKTKNKKTKIQNL